MEFYLGPGPIYDFNLTIPEDFSLQQARKEISSLSPPKQKQRIDKKISSFLSFLVEELPPSRTPTTSSLLQDLPPPKDSMANAPDDQGYDYVPEQSSTGIFYADDNERRMFFHWRPIPTNPNVIPVLSVCSSSKGLIICRDDCSIYYVGNPFINGPNAYISLPRPPRRHSTSSTSVVLTDDLSNPTTPIFYLICAVWYEGTKYYFDIFSSRKGTWETSNRILTHLLRPMTGVSCATSAYWLMQNGRIVRYDPSTRILGFLTEPGIPRDRVFAAQLGRVGDNIGVVIVSRPPTIRVELHMYQGGVWTLYAHMNWAPWRGIRWFPHPIRFESFKMEVLFLVNGSVVVWEEMSPTIPGPRSNRLRVLLVHRNIPTCVNGAIPQVCVNGAIPHVFSSLDPNSYPMTLSLGSF